MNARPQRIRLARRARPAAFILLLSGLLWSGEVALALAVLRVVGGF